MTHDDALPARFTLAEVAAFLDGSGTLDGVAFGERHPTEPGAYWWRKHLRAALAARAVPVAVVLKGALDTLAEYGCSDTRLYKPGDAPDQEWGVPLYAAPPALPPGAREAMRMAADALRAIVRHWDEFGPEHGFDEVVDQARRTLEPGPPLRFPHDDMGTPT